MYYQTINDESYASEIKSILNRLGLTGLRPEYMVLQLLKSHFNDWSKILALREEVIQDSN